MPRDIKTSQLIQRLKGEPNLRLLGGFTDVPGKGTFSRALTFLSGQGIFEQTLDGIVSMAHKGLVLYQVNRDSTAIQVREKVLKKGEEDVPKADKKRAESPPRKSRQSRMRKHRLRESTRNAHGGARNTVKGMYHFGKGTNCTLMSVTADFL
ncbi:hypothetical protein Holit_01864 [Hollandina sp. SP2]